MVIGHSWPIWMTLEYGLIPKSLGFHVTSIKERYNVIRTTIKIRGAIKRSYQLGQLPKRGGAEDVMKC